MSETESLIDQLEKDLKYYKSQSYLFVALSTISIISYSTIIFSLVADKNQNTLIVSMTVGLVTVVIAMFGLYRSHQAEISIIKSRIFGVRRLLLAAETSDKGNGTAIRDALTSDVFVIAGKQTKLGSSTSEDLSGSYLPAIVLEKALKTLLDRYDLTSKNANK